MPTTEITATLGEPRLASPTDPFIAATLPDWLRRASPAQLNELRDSFKQYRSSQDALREATVDLIPLQAYAQQQFAAILPASVNAVALEWLDVRREFGVVPGVHWPYYRARYVRQPGLLRLMQNFTSDDALLEGSGLVAPGGDTILSGDPANLARTCRELDVGKSYQQMLTRVFDAQAEAQLKSQKRAGLRLATQVAALKGDLDAQDQLALREIAGSEKDTYQKGLRGYPGTLTVLGCRIADAMLVNLRDEAGNAQGVILYLPSAPARALWRYASSAAMQEALVAELKKPAYRDYFSQLVSLDERAAFLSKLDIRLKDDLPDLQVDGHAVGEDVFASLVAQQLKRLKDDARVLLVPTADADQIASNARLQGWESVGLGLVNLAGLFIPVVGALLLGQLLVQTLGEVYEGAAHWLHGHQHEALEHMLGVAETLAVGVAVAGGASIVARGFARSTFVEGLEPVSVEGRENRLWSSDLSVYQSLPVGATLQADGLYAAGERRWMRVQRRYYQVDRSQPEGPWRLRHPWDEHAYGPRVQYNGERGWRLPGQRPLEWNDPAQMLDCLWPQSPPIDKQRAEQVLRVAGMDRDELRGVLVENRPAPVNLRDTLQRFTADARIEAFLDHVRTGALNVDEADILGWLKAQPGVQGEGELLRQAIVQRLPALRAALLEYLVRLAPSTDSVLALIRQDFPGLPEAYAHELLGEVSAAQRTQLQLEARLPLDLAEKARSLSRIARLSRALEGLYLGSSYRNETGELVLKVLPSLPNWPASLHLQLREGHAAGRLLAEVVPAELGQQRTILVHSNGRFALYDHQGGPLAAVKGEPGALFEALAMTLSAGQLSALGIHGTQPSAQLQEWVQEHLPNSPSALARLLGWPEQAAWFNPGRRMPDGRVGYPLSGRGAVGGAHDILRMRLRALYPGLNDSELEVEMQRLVQGERPAYQALLDLEDDDVQLHLHLDRWVSAELNTTRRGVRQHFVNAVRRAWRLQGEWVHGHDGQPQGQRLSLIGLGVTTLPELPPQVEFHRLTSLVLTDTQISQVPVDFLRPMSALRALNLSNNRLRSFPIAVAYLPELRVLRLARNEIRMDAQTQAILRGAGQLTHLDLSYNPLGMLDMSFNQLSRLVELSLRNCRLGTWPARIELCGFLERADLRDNQLVAVPDEVLQMPYAYRRAFLIDRNPLGLIATQSLYALDTVVEHAHAPEAAVRVDAQATRRLWLATVEPALLAARSQLWDTQEAMPGSAGLFRLFGLLLHTADYAQAGEGGGRAYLTRRLWALLQALEGQPELRERISRRAEQPLTCENTVADRFSVLQVEVLLADTEANAAYHERGTQLLEVGRQLFCLERLEQVANQEIWRRLNAREHVDQAALSLIYRVRLRVRLNLPFQPRSMRYAEAASVTDAQVEQAFATVQAAQTFEALSESLSQRSFWQRYLRDRHEASFAAIEADYNQRIARLARQTPALSTVELQARSDLLRDQQARAVQNLRLQLTRQWLYGRERGLA
ncbi:NEL-type E3 ubiquitin ligase domain-containing protein [Pseudomonas putida]